MRRLRVFLCWSPGTRQLWLTALLLAGTARLGLWLLPLRSVRGALRRLAWLAASRLGPRPTPGRVVWAVMSASRHVPRTTCLVRALAVQALLEAQGCPVRLRIGVARGPRLMAHAWVEDAHGIVVEGEAGVSGYTPLLTFAEVPSHD